MRLCKKCQGRHGSSIEERAIGDSRFCFLSREKHLSIGLCVAASQFLDFWKEEKTSPTIIPLLQALGDKMYHLYLRVPIG